MNPKEWALQENGTIRLSSPLRHPLPFIPGGTDSCWAEYCGRPFTHISSFHLHTSCEVGVSYPHFTGEETEAQMGSMTGPRCHCYWGVELESGLQSLFPEQLRPSGEVRLKGASERIPEQDSSAAGGVCVEWRRGLPWWSWLTIVLSVICGHRSFFSPHCLPFPWLPCESLFMTMLCSRLSWGPGAVGGFVASRGQPCPYPV